MRRRSYLFSAVNILRSVWTHAHHFYGAVTVFFDEFDIFLGVCRQVFKTFASGDIFIASKELKEKIVSEFSAICGEMEGGAIAHVAAANGIPFAVLRSISDGGDDEASMDYPTFKKTAAEKSAAIILKYIEGEKAQLAFNPQ